VAHVGHPHHQHDIGARRHPIALLHRSFRERTRLEGVEALDALAVERDLDDGGEAAAEGLGDTIATWRSMTPASTSRRTRRSAVAGDTRAASASAWLERDASSCSRLNKR
jgi:hypothetical protein